MILVGYVSSGQVFLRHRDRLFHSHIGFIARSNSPKKPPFEALTEPDVKLSLHPALIIQLYIYL